MRGGRARSPDISGQAVFCRISAYAVRRHINTGANTTGKKRVVPGILCAGAEGILYAGITHAWSRNMKRKKGDGVLLIITKLFSVAALAAFASAVWPSVAWPPLHGQSLHSVFAAGVLLLLCAGATCVRRKRYFTRAD